MLYLLFILEYGTRNSQAPFTTELDANGCHQGGLGAGVTNMSDWSSYNGNYPIIKCGAANTLGNNSGEVDYSVENDTEVVYAAKVNKYRGIEIPFGHVWKWSDGINIDVKTDADGGTSSVYVCSSPSLFSDTDNEDYELRGLEARSNGYAKTIIGGGNGDIIPTEVGGGSSTFFCDYHYTDINSSSLRGVLFGGSANAGSSAGFAYAGSNYSPAAAIATIGSRLCFLPNNN